MKRLSKSQVKFLEEVKERLGAAAEALEGAQEAHRDHLEEEWEAVADAWTVFADAVERYNDAAKEHLHTDICLLVDGYNAAVTEAVEFAEELQSEAQDYFDERSEKWQESEKGEAYEAWIGAFDEVVALEPVDAAVIHLDPVDYSDGDDPPELEVVEADFDALEALPVEPEG